MSTDQVAAQSLQQSDQLQQLSRELAEARALFQSTRASLELQGLRGDGLQASLDGARHRLGQLERSVSWRLTTPIRYVRAFAAGRLPSGRSFSQAATHLADIYDKEGLPGLRRRVVRRLPLPAPRSARREAPASPARSDLDADATPGPYETPTPDAHRAVLAPSVLIIAELSIPQCAKYRVWQKQELLQSLGWTCRVIGWRELDQVMTALQFCTEVILYRVPGEPAVLDILAEAKRLGLDPWWEVDDLIFDEPLYRKNSNLATLAPDLRRQVLAGIRLYRRAMLSCRRTIASTSRLAQCMAEAGIETTQVVENALDAGTLEVAASLRLRREHAARSHSAPRHPADAAAGPAPVTIVYGSGTKTHDADFLVAGPAILSLMQRHSQVRLRIVGDLTLPPGFERVSDRVEELAGTDYRAYLGLLAQADIAIAPLEATLFNDAKSNIKFQEASILGLPSVVSPRQAFRDVVVQDSNGLLADTREDWETALERLVLDPQLRQRLGARALIDVTTRYAPDRIAEEQVSALFGRPPTMPRKPLRILAANIFFAPQSFGGATIVAEQMAARLARTDDVELCVFTSRPAIPGRPNSVLRYDQGGIPVFATSLSSAGDQVVQLDNPSMVTTFGHLLDAIRPDVVHAHSIQGFGAPILRLCRERGIPYVVTLHDAWWLCDRQFMVRGDNRYCFQTRIDLRVCQDCLPASRHLHERMRIMMSVLRGASLLLSPSESHRQLYLANGIDPDRLRVNRNGIRMPRTPRQPRKAGMPLRFGFVGGAEPIKGFHLIRRAFESLERSDWELVLVDNTLNLGFRSIDVSAWKVEGRITVIPAYTQDGLDGFFQGIDVLLFPSQWKESFGLSVREALARDVWVIATSGGGQAEAIEDGINGRLIPLDGRADSLVEAISELLVVPQRFDTYSNPLAASIATYDMQAAELLDALREVSARGPAALPAPPVSQAGPTLR
ncbi:glycosyltransferase [Lichenicola sp.]|uniref:glycosyltransferase n=1 Tax=Lichenicola sp. TaxID=2804529 RepID=UPI003B008A69